MVDSVVQTVGGAGAVEQRRVALHEPVGAAGGDVDVDGDDELWVAPAMDPPWSFRTDEDDDLPTTALGWECFISELSHVTAGRRSLLGGGAWESKRGTLSAAASASATYFAKRTGTALPIICSVSVRDATHWKPGGKVWISACSAVVRGIVLSTVVTSPACPGYPAGIGRLTPRIVGDGSSIEKTPRRA